ncbi:MAG: succinylglutamate desuccinylase/aspartoacylase family protein [Bernardetiaceae bacterium]|nr:succinylglutamate desuccinylase/aspartoacylase family protein [Bernardetiaceae bacterium]
MTLESLPSNEEIPARIIGDVAGEPQQTLLLITACLHGNEIAGLKALRYIFEYLESNQIPIKGRLIALLGNRKAYMINERGIQYDLNRIWHLETIHNIEKHKKDSPEHQELAELLQVIHAIPHQKYQRRVFLDLHTTSGANGVFAIATDTSDVRVLQGLGAPIITGLAGKLKGMAMKYLDTLDYESFAFEGGLHQDPEAFYNIILAVWRTLEHLDMIETHVLPQNIVEKAGIDKLVSECAVPKFLDVHYVHHIKPKDNFAMKPGFRNFDFVRKGELLATDRKGGIFAHKDSFLLMPLYQKQGEDGFFLTE